MKELKKCIRMLCLTVGTCLVLAYFSESGSRLHEIKSLWFGMVVFTSLILLYDSFRGKYDSLPKTFGLLGSLVSGGLICILLKKVYMSSVQIKIEHTTTLLLMIAVFLGCIWLFLFGLSKKTTSSLEKKEETN